MTTPRAKLGGLSVDYRLTYSSWVNMNARCRSEKHPSWKHYGGRGIVVCDRWRTSFANFLNDMGPRLSSDLSIDRIDPDGNYEPGNCRWATSQEQSLNRKRRKPRKRKTAQQPWYERRTLSDIQHADSWDDCND